VTDHNEIYILHHAPFLYKLLCAMCHAMWMPVTTAWRALWLRVETESRYGG